MINIEIRKVEIETYVCDSCHSKIIQDGKDIELIPSMKTDKYAFHFHRSCLIRHLSETWIPNDERK